jgi:hypothetical protein
MFISALSVLSFAFLSRGKCVQQGTEKNEFRYRYAPVRRSRKAHRQECLCYLTPSASAWGFDADYGAGWGAECAFRWEAARAAFDDDFIFSGAAWSASL